MPKHILIADDEPAIARTLQIHLESKGYEVSVALDGREALQQLDARRPDLIILDVSMPYASGFEVLEIIRDSPDTRNIPVIIVTAKASDPDIVQGWRSGADCYLTKPIDTIELMTFIERILNPPADASVEC